MRRVDELEQAPGEILERRVARIASAPLEPAQRLLQRRRVLPTLSARRDRCARSPSAHAERRRP
jgi:hypothetical protein